MSIEVQAVVCEELEKPLVVQQVSLAPPKDNEVLVKIMATGVCASDVHVIYGKMSSPLPVVLGHEGSGIVEEVGKNVKLIKKGDHVALSWSPDCGHCFFCDSGLSHLCEVSAPVVLSGGLLDGTSRLQDKYKNTVYHYSFLSTWAEYAVVEETSCIVIDKSLDLIPASLIGCAVMTGVGAAMNTAQVKAGSCVAVIGLGGVGLNVIQGSRICGAEKIIGIDTMQDRKQMATTFGMTDFINSKETDPLERVKELTNGYGVDYCFEVVGNHQLIELGYHLIRRRGVLVCVGVAPEGTQASFLASKIPREEKTITGSFYGSANCRLNLPKIIKLYQTGKLLLDELVTQTLPLTQVNQAIADLSQGSVIRTVLKPHH